MTHNTSTQTNSNGRTRFNGSVKTVAASRPAPVTNPVLNRSFDIEKWVEVSDTTKLGIYRVPVHPGTRFDIASIPLRDENLGAMRAALMSHPSQAWLKDDKLVLMYTADDFPTFCDKYGLVIDGPVGKRDKRMSRLWRPQAMFCWTRPTNLKVKYVQRGLVRGLSQDGVNWISRRALTWMVEWRIRTERLTTQQARALRRMARHAMRVEITFVNHLGQFKGHAIVVDTNEWDLMLVEGTEKPEVRIKDKSHRVYLSAEVKHVSELWQDRQSFANLNVDGFFGDKLQQWTAERCEWQLDQFDEGKYTSMVTEMGETSRWATDAAKLFSYPIFEYILSGGDPKWFGQTTRMALTAWLKGAKARGQDRKSFPLPGGNYYVAPVSAARDAGLDIDVPRGYARLDEKYATVWINDVDLVTSNPDFEDIHSLETHVAGDQARLDAIREKDPGLMQIWSGSDDDDMLRAFPFQEHKIEYVLLWRSPNQLGQFAYLKLTEDTDYPKWCRWTKYVPEMDTNKLPHPARWEGSKIKNLIQPYQMEKVKAFSLGAIFEAAKKMVNSAGAVGLHCLSLRFSVGTLGKLPDDLPAEVSDLIDAAVKEFSDCSEVNEHNREFLRWLCEQSTQPNGNLIPATYAEEIAKLFANDKKPPQYKADTTGKHWVDKAYAETDEVLAWYKDEIEVRARAALPPQDLYDAGLKAMHAGYEVRKIWGAYWGPIIKADNEKKAKAKAGELPATKGAELYDEVDPKEAQEALFSKVRASTMKYLQDMFPAAYWPMVMVGGLAITYAMILNTTRIDEHDKTMELSDKAFWQLGESKGKNKGRHPGIADMTIQGLREIGLIGEPMFEDETGTLISYEQIRGSLKAGEDTYKSLRGKMFIADAQRETSKVVILSVRNTWFYYGMLAGILPKLERIAQAHRYHAECEAAKKKVQSLELKGHVFLTGQKTLKDRDGHDVVYPALVGPKGNLVGLMNRMTALEYIPASIRVEDSVYDSDDNLWLIGREPEVEEEAEAEPMLLAA